MASIEITGKSLDDAKKAAAAKLGVSEGDVKVTVLEETKGLFGKSNVRVRAEVADAKAVPAKTAAVAEEDAAPAKKPRGRGKAIAVVESDAASQPLEDIQESMEEPPPAEVAKAARANGRRKAAPAADGAGAPAEDEAGDRAAAAATQADADQLLELVRMLLDAGDLEVTAKVSQIAGRYVNIEIDGKDVAFLVGKHGEVINALQYLVNIIAGRRYDNGVRATLDGNDYRRRREDALTALATKIADQVRQRQEEAVLDALPAFERRIVHKALSEYGGVQTYSEGEEPNRRVVIAPAE